MMVHHWKTMSPSKAAIFLRGGTRSRSTYSIPLIHSALKRSTPSSLLLSTRALSTLATTTDNVHDSHTSWKAWMLGSAALGAVGLATMEEHYNHRYQNRAQCCGIAGVVGANHHDAR
jgi:hypothetical protein